MRCIASPPAVSEKENVALGLQPSPRTTHSAPVSQPKQAEPKQAEPAKKVTFAQPTQPAPKSAVEVMPDLGPDPYQLVPLFKGGGGVWAKALKGVLEQQPDVAKILGPKRGTDVVPVRELTFQALKPNPPENWKLVRQRHHPRSSLDKTPIHDTSRPLALPCSTERSALGTIRDLAS